MSLPPDRGISSSGINEAAALLAPLTDLVLRAGAAILSLDRQSMHVRSKSDQSPVTEADLAADRIIADGLARLCQEIPVVSEERMPSGLSSSGTFFMIDPLDGTKEFIAGRAEFTVNLALVTDGWPILGIVGAPALGLIWRGIVGRNAERLSADQPQRAESIRTRTLPRAGERWVAAVSRSHADAASEAFIDSRTGAQRQRLGSALKFAKVAQGEADIYPRLAPTHEWDVAAGAALVAAAGGKITDPSGASLRFGNAGKNFIIPAFIAWGDPSGA